MERLVILILLLAILSSHVANQLNILVIFPHPGKSHFQAFARFFESLAQKGHNVTVISNFPVNKSIPNYRDVILKGDVYKFFQTEEGQKYTDLEQLLSKRTLIRYFLPLAIGKVAEETCENGLENEAFKRFLNEKNIFDVAIIEYFNSDCFVPVAKKFDIPVIRAHCSLMPWTRYRYANPNNPSYLPNMFLPFNGEMTFLQRVENCVITWIDSIYFNFVVLRREKSILLKSFGPLSESLYGDVLNHSLLLLASHFTANFPRPLVPNIIEVGGIHIEKPKVLPKVRNATSNLHEMSFF